MEASHSSFSCFLVQDLLERGNEAAPAGGGKATASGGKGHAGTVAAGSAPGLAQSSMVSSHASGSEHSSALNLDKELHEAERRKAERLAREKRV